MLVRTVKLDYPIYTLDNRVLLAAGDKLSPGILEDLIARNMNRSYKTTPFLEHGDVRHDLARSFQEPPYSLIFEEPERTFTLGLMKKMRFIAPVLEFLDYFKEHEFYTYRHTLMVFALSTILARDLLGKSEDVIMEAMAGTIHDFGKICVPLEILRKTDPLTRTNKNVLEHHALAGFILLSYYHQDQRSFAARVAKEHHERRDGSGYPYGLLLRETMIEAIAICDVYDALITPRPYRPSAYDNRTALEEITEMARQGKLSRKVVQALIAHVRKDRPPFRECKISLEKRGKPPAHNLYGVIEDEKPDSAKRKGDA